MRENKSEEALESLGIYLILSLFFLEEVVLSLLEMFLFSMPKLNCQFNFVLFIFIYNIFFLLLQWAAV